MTILEINKKTDSIAYYLRKRLLKNAFDEIRILINELNDWNVAAELENNETTYKYMLQYMLSGTEDPEREKVYNKLLKASYTLADKVIYQLREKCDYRYYYLNKRMIALGVQSDFHELSDGLQDIATKISLSDLLEDLSSAGSVNHQKALESQSVLVFKHIWMSDGLSSEDKTVLAQLIQNPAVPVPYRALLISALLLGLKEMFDEEKILLLLDAYDSEEIEISQRALVALLLVLFAYDERLFLYPRIGDRLQHLSESPSFVQNIHTVIKQFILTKETEKITKKINEELLPEMIKISPKISQKINLSELMDTDGIEEKNPEWQNILEEAGLTDKLQEMSELQMEGADVMHSSFSNLKVFPFFYEFSNWFLPFHSRHSSVVAAGEATDVIDSLAGVGYICNSDKYSLCFSLQQMPGQYRGMALKQMLSETAEFLKQQNEDSLVPDSKAREIVSNQYIHDLYRFYKVHPKKVEFEDIFASSLAFYNTTAIGHIISDEKSLLSIGEYYFNKNQYEDARNVFERLHLAKPDDSILLQKIAYCKQMTGDVEGALSNYLRSDLILSGNSWTLKKIASCYRILKQPQKALEYYRKVEALTPDNLSVQLSIGHCYLELRHYQEALNAYFKVEYLNSKSTKSWRPIAWCSFLTGKFEQAVNYYEKILGDNPKMSDYLNYGHALLAMKDIRKATEIYKLSIDAAGSSKEKFVEAFSADMPELIQAGVAQNDLPILLDQVLYSYNA